MMSIRFMKMVKRVLYTVEARLPQSVICCAPELLKFLWRHFCNARYGTICTICKIHNEVSNHQDPGSWIQEPGSTSLDPGSALKALKIQSKSYIKCLHKHLCNLMIQFVATTPPHLIFMCASSQICACSRLATPSLSI